MDWYAIRVKSIEQKNNENRVEKQGRNRK